MKKKIDDFVLENPGSSLMISCGALKESVSQALNSMEQQQVCKRFYDKDPSLWETDLKEVALINDGMGWIDLPNNFEQTTAELTTFAQQIKKEGFKHAVLLGMGGSSLCSEVARETFGNAEGYPELLVLDNTEPAAILAIENQIDIEQTLFIAASKSGGTKETISFFKYFYLQLAQKSQRNPGDNFVAITDAATPLVSMANVYGFRKIFINPKGIGGRYSVLSDFGLLPMALMGIDIEMLMQRAKQMKTSSDAKVPVITNPAILLGASLGVFKKNGRDKITFVLSASIRSFGYWVEQLLAESTGKEGKGLIPVNGEELATPDVYGDDRVFVHLYLSADNNDADEQKLLALEGAGHPVVHIALEDKMSLGAEYYRWEIATAISGMVIGINPFDQPNVEQSKKNTNDLLAEWQQEKSFKIIEPFVETDDISVYSSSALAIILQHKTDTVAAYIDAFLGLARPHDYIAFLPYFTLTPSRTALLQEWRKQTRDVHKTATTLLNGPRYLHSTGQLHKGGPNSGLYILLVADEALDLPIPDENFGFATLHEAQSLGDFSSLEDKGRRVIRIRLGKDIDKGLEQLWANIN